MDSPITKGSDGEGAVVRQVSITEQTYMYIYPNPSITIVFIDVHQKLLQIVCNVYRISKCCPRLYVTMHF